MIPAIAWEIHNIFLQKQPRNKEQEKEVLDWIYNVLGEKAPSGNYEDILKDGIVLCKLINKIVPGSVKKIQERGTNFQLMENVQRFQAAIKKYGLPEEEIFQTADLFERRNIPQVTLCLYSLARLVSVNYLQAIVEFVGKKIQIFNVFVQFRHKSIQNTLDQHWDQKWPKKTNEHSPKLNCVRTRVSLTYRWVSTKVQHNLDTVEWATHVICKIEII